MWLVAAIGLTFAAFPSWYAAMLPALYLPLVVILLLLAVRGVALEFRGKAGGRRWRRGWDAALASASAGVAAVWGAVLAVLTRGLALGPDGSVSGAGLGRSLSPLVSCPGAGRRARRTARGGAAGRHVPGPADDRAAAGAGAADGVVAGVRRRARGRGGGGGLGLVGSGSWPLLAGAVLLTAAGLLSRARWEAMAFGVVALGVAAAVVAVFAGHGDVVLTSTLDPAWSLTRAGAAAGGSALRLLTGCRGGGAARGGGVPGLLVLGLPPPGGQRAGGQRAGVLMSAGPDVGRGTAPGRGRGPASGRGAAPGRGPASGRGAVPGRGPVDPRLLRHARSSRGGLAALGVLGAGQAAVTVAVAFALSRLVTGFATWAVVVLAGAYGVRALLSWQTAVVAQRTSARVTDELRRRSLAAALRHGPAWIARYGSGRLVAVLTSGLDALAPWFGGYLPALALGVALPPLVVVVMAVVDPASALIAVLTLPLIPVLGALIGWATQARAQQRWDADARLAGHFLDVVQGLPTLKIFGRAERQTAIVAAMTEKHRSATMRVLRVAFLSSTALDLVGTLAVGLIAVSAGLRVAGGSLALGPALLVILLAPEAYRPLREVAARYHAGAAATAVITDVDLILTADPSPAAPAPSATHAGVTTSGLRVRYPGTATDALRLASFEARAGRLTVVRGTSGAGKTTLLRVLAGLQAADDGTAVVDGPVLHLPQRPLLPHARTVADVFGDGAGAAAVMDALATVGLDRELGPDTPLGERGQGVSAGQRQRLALAALLRQAWEAPAVLLLDEPTAHLDPATERLVIGELRAAADRGCAVVAVAHRTALLAAADTTIDVVAPSGSPNQPDSVREEAPSRPVATTAPVRPQRRTADVESRHPPRGRALAAAGLGAGSSLAGVVLTGTATWLLVRASAMPPVLTLSAAVVLVRASAIARPLLRYAERLVSHDLAFARLGARRARVYAALVPRVPGPRLHRRGDLLTRVVTDVDAQVDGLLRGRLPALATAATMLAAGTAAALTDPAVTAPLAAGLAVAAVLAPALAGRRDTAVASARAQLGDAVVEAVDGVEDGADLTVPDHRSTTLARHEARAARTGGLATAIGHLGWGIVVTGAALTLAPGIWGGVVLLGLVALGEPVAALPDAATAGRAAAASRRRLAALDHEPVNRGTRVAGEGVRIRGLTAGWDPDRPAALQDLDLDIPAGTSLAVRGPSGSGKSTLAAVLAGLLDPRAGTVSCPGRTALVSDDADHLFASTVRDNLRLARPGATDDELREVLDRAGLAGWDLDATLGAGGTTVSGGQRKRFSVARALLTDPDLLILDEPTEGLDGPAAADLIERLLKGRTVLLLTHRTEGLDRVGRTAEIAGRRIRTSTTADA